MPTLPILRASLIAASLAAFASAQAQPHGGMLRYPDVGKTHIVFVYANDIWLAPREGGTAIPLASPPGLEAFPRFSADGKSIAFVGNYDGNRDLYTIPVDGGTPTRVTHHPGAEVLCDWLPAGQAGAGGNGRLLFFTNAFAGRNRQTQLFTVSSKGGLPERLAVPYGANGSVSPDGQWLAYTPHSIDTRTWKRYRGGMATDIWLFNLRTNASRKITEWEGTDTLPMWHGDLVYYVSDAGPDKRLNIWSFNPASNDRKQVTKFADFDVKWPSVGPGASGAGEIVFQLGSTLQLLDLRAGQSKAVNIVIPGARPKLREQAADAGKLIRSWDISPSAKRVVVQARGDIWTVPGEKGVPRNLTRTSAVAERDPVWSPDGRWIAYFSDASGEYDLYLVQSDGAAEPRRLTTDGAWFRMEPAWSPDSKKITFFDKTGSIFVHALGEGAAAGETKPVDKDPWSGDGTGITISWSHDSRFLAYDRAQEETPSKSIWVWNAETGEKTRLTAGYFNERSPQFDRKGDHLFFISNRAFRPEYGDTTLDTTFIYQNTEQIIAAPLRTDVKRLWAPESDEEKWDDKKKDEKKEGEKKDDDAKKDEGDGAKPADGEKKDEPSKNGDSKAPAKDDGVSGVWEGKLTGAEPLPPEGATFTLTLSLGADNSVTGSLSAMGSTGAVTGKYDPDSKSLTLTGTMPSGPSFSGTLTIAGEAISGSLTAAEMGVTATVDGKRTSKGGADKGKGDAKKDDDKPREKVEIVAQGFEARCFSLPVKAGQFGRLAVNDKGDLLYVRRAAPGGDADARGSIKLLGLKDDKKEEKTVAASANGFAITADGKKLLVLSGDSSTIQDAAAGATGKPVLTAGMTTLVDPRAEWRQVFLDSWRIQRDYFYDPNMHGVDWAKTRDQYAPMLEDCASREDVGYVIAEMISELNVGHAYYREGGGEDEPSVAVGMLGCDFELRDGAYRFARIHRGAEWDTDAVGPLSALGADVKEGMYLLAVNGAPVDTAKDPWAAFVGLVGKPVVLTVSEKPTRDETAKTVVVEPAGGETNLRYRAWIEERRRYIDEKTGGKVGYIYVPSTGIDGQNDLVRQFFAQTHKAALIIDDRWNAGGQIPTRFIELLNRPATNYWARRDGVDWKWPPDSHQGPKCMLINGLAGSGGDAFPYYFRQAKLGKLIGMRTWGGLVGISGNPQLIDGAAVTVPTFGFYETDGTWGVEGHGVDPDIEVIDDPALMVPGTPGPGGRGDPQLDAAIAQMLKELETSPHTPAKRPAYPNRAGMGLPPADR